MTEQLDLTVVALVALVAIVGLVALVMQAASAPEPASGPIPPNLMQYPPDAAEPAVGDASKKAAAAKKNNV
jgi:hypothetical protein